MKVKGDKRNIHFIVKLSSYKLFELLIHKFKMFKMTSKVRECQKDTFEMSDEVEQTLSRIDSDPLVVGSVVISKEGSILRTSIDTTITSQVHFNYL